MSDATPTTSIVAEMKTPRVGGPGIAIWYSFLSIFVGLAIWHVFRARQTPLVTLIASGLWLAFIGVGIAIRSYYEGGSVQFFVDRLGEFGADRFMAVERTSEEPPLVCFGYRIRDRRFYCLKVRINEIISVSWCSGQATALAGRDMNDWYTALKYETDRVTMVSKMFLRENGCLVDVYCFGPSGSKEAIDEFGKSVVKFLCDSGLVLNATEKGRKFVNPNRLPKNDPATTS